MKKLGFGCMRLPLIDPAHPEKIDLPQVCDMVDAFLKGGFTYVDTAYMYHNYQSECAVREVLVKRHPRDSFVLASKLPVVQLKKPEDQERIFNEQLEKCGVDYFDYYLLHNLNADHYGIAQRLNSFEFVAHKKAEGKVRKIGFSHHDSARLLDEILTAHPEMDFVQLQINYLDWENPGIQSRECYEVATRHGKPVIVMEPVKGGTLAALPDASAQLLKHCRPDRSLASWAVRYAASLDNVMVVLSGMSDLEQLLDNTSYMADLEPLTAEEHVALERVVELLRGSAAIPCTACRYCVEGCPQQIPIPDYIALYNAHLQSLNKGFSIHEDYYESLTRTQSKASDCIGCRLCEQACPQHLAIADGMQKIAHVFEGK